jgi:hypothetical protein
MTNRKSFIRKIATGQYEYGFTINGKTYLQGRSWSRDEAMFRVSTLDKA